MNFETILKIAKPLVGFAAVAVPVIQSFIDKKEMNDAVVKAVAEELAKRGIE